MLVRVTGKAIERREERRRGEEAPCVPESAGPPGCAACPRPLARLPELQRPLVSSLAPAAVVFSLCGDEGAHDKPKAGQSTRLDLDNLY